MFVGEDRHCLSGLSKHFYDRLHQFVPRIKMLAAIVVGVVAMLADQTHAIDREVVASERQRVFYRRINREAVFRCKTTAAVGWVEPARCTWTRVESGAA